MRITKNRVIELKNRPSVYSSAACAGKTESEGPYREYFDMCFEDDGIGECSWEKAEEKLLLKSMECATEKAGLGFDDIEMIFAGDLLNQCTASSYSVRNKGIGFAGLFGACSTMAYSVALSSLFVNAGYVDTSVAATSSHFCSAEKQFRYPLEYGCQRTPSSQRTVTGAGAYVIGKNLKNRVCVNRVLFGSVIDYGIKDSSNMGAAMAPAAADSIAIFLEETKKCPEDYDMILTGDLGAVGSSLLKEILKNEYNIDISGVHNDCGVMIYGNNNSVNSGGSGCGCSALITAGYIMQQLNKGILNKVLFAGTGALMSPLISLQGESIPAIAHIVEFIGME